MANTKDLADLSGARKLILGAAVVLLVDSFLAWYHVSIGTASANASGWHDIGPVAWVLTIALLVVEGCRIAGVLPLDDARAELLSLALAAAVLLFGLIYVIQRLSDGYLGYGFWIGLVAFIVLGVGAYGVFRSGDAMTTLKSMQASSGGGGTGGAGGAGGGTTGGTDGPAGPGAPPA